MSIHHRKGRVGAPVGAERVGTLWKMFLWLAAGFNLLVGMVSFALPGATIHDWVIAVLVMSFGAVYAFVASDPRRFAPILWAGVVGKVAVVALLGPAALGPPLDALTLSVLAADLVFAIGFVLFLMRRIDNVA